MHGGEPVWRSVKVLVDRTSKALLWIVPSGIVTTPVSNALETTWSFLSKKGGPPGTVNGIFNLLSVCMSPLEKGYGWIVRGDEYEDVSTVTSPWKV